MTSSRPSVVVILAAGEGKRMKSATPKVLHEVAGRSLLGHVIEAATGNGPVDACINALNKAINQDERVSLDVYHVEAITGGTDARVDVEVNLRQGARVVSSRGTNEDIVLASVDAYLKGVNVFSSMRKRKQK